MYTCFIVCNFTAYIVYIDILSFCSLSGLFSLFLHPYHSSSMCFYFCYFFVINYLYSGTSLLRSPTGLGKSDLYGEVTLLPEVICTVEYNLGLSQGDCNWEVFLQVR